MIDSQGKKNNQEWKQWTYWCEAGSWQITRDRMCRRQSPAAGTVLHAELLDSFLKVTQKLQRSHVRGAAGGSVLLGGGADWHLRVLVEERHKVTEGFSSAVKETNTKTHLTVVLLSEPVPATKTFTFGLGVISASGRRDFTSLSCVFTDFLENTQTCFWALCKGSIL